jgi:hypothetical protein
VQVQDLLLSTPWPPRHPPLAALRKLTVTGLLAAPNAFMDGFAPNLTSLHISSIRSCRAAAVAAAAAAAAEHSSTGMGSAGPMAATEAVAADCSPLAGIATLGHGHCLQELVVMDCGRQSSSSSSSARTAAAPEQ